MQSGNRHILVLETSSRQGSVALATQEGLTASARLPGLMRHAGELLPAIEAMLRERGWPVDSLTDVFLSIGPGSFTGLRVGVTVARTLAWSITCKIVAVPTVDSLALNALQADPVPRHLAVILDAKQSRVFAAAFELIDTNSAVSPRAPTSRGLQPARPLAAGQREDSKPDEYQGIFRKVIEAHMADPVEVLGRCPRPLAVLGEGIPHHRQAVDNSGATVLPETLWWPRAENVYAVGLRMAQAGQYTPAGDLLPLYIRRPEAEEKWEKLHGPQGRRVT